MSVINVDSTQRHLEEVYRKALNSKKYITIEFLRAGFQVNCPTLTGLPGPVGSQDRVCYHFMFKVSIEILRNDQGTEFHNLQDWIDSLYKDETLIIDNRSIDIMANDLYMALVTRFSNNRDMIIEIIASQQNEREGITCYYNKN